MIFTHQTGKVQNEKVEKKMGIVINYRYKTDTIIKQFRTI